jgi:hypothetical protein
MTYGKAEGAYKSSEPLILWQKLDFDYDKRNRKGIFGKFYHCWTLLSQTICGVDKYRDLEIMINIRNLNGAICQDMPLSIC